MQVHSSVYFHGVHKFNSIFIFTVPREDVFFGEQNNVYPNKNLVQVGSGTFSAPNHLTPALALIRKGQVITAFHINTVQNSLLQWDHYSFNLNASLRTYPFTWNLKKHRLCTVKVRNWNKTESSLLIRVTIHHSFAFNCCCTVECISKFVSVVFYT